MITVAVHGSGVIRATDKKARREMKDLQKAIIRTTDSVFSLRS